MVEYDSSLISGTLMWVLSSFTVVKTLHIFSLQTFHSLR